MGQIDKRETVRQFLTRVHVEGTRSTFMEVPLQELTSDELIKIIHLVQEARLQPPHEPGGFLQMRT
jgi:hypothetical protein